MSSLTVGSHTGWDTLQLVAAVAAAAADGVAADGVAAPAGDPA